MPSAARIASQDRWLTNIFTGLITLAFLGYPVLGVYSSFAGGESNTISVVFRSITLGVSIFSLGVMIAFVEPNRWRSFGIIFAAFAAMCVARLIVDSQEDPQAGELLVRYVGIILVPTLCLSTLVPEYDERKAALALALVGSAFCIVMLALYLTGAQTLIESTEASQERLTLTRLNPISISQTALTAMIAIYVVLAKRRPPFWVSAVLLIGAACGLVLMGYTGSRSPLIALALVLVTVLVTQGRFFAAGFLAFGLLAVGGTLASLDIVAFDRFLTAGSDNSSIARIDTQSNAIAAVLTNPIFGTYFVEPITGTYPHNTFLHAALSFGIPGLMLFSVLFIGAAGTAVRRAQRGELLLPLLFIGYGTVAQFSGSIFESEYWPLLAMLLVKPRPARRRTMPTMMVARPTW